VEPSPAIRRGDVAAINAAGSGGGGGDFFISLAAHDDWASSFTVWGRVTAGMHVVQHLVQREYTQTLHSSGTAMRMLAAPVPIAVQLL
jgi:cyclophilin family peptidyl-prolyl cis-trans isomerase